MNVNVKKRILCFGDSNTWGDPPNGVGRYPTSVRWTGLLQEKLGEDYEVIEEGLCGRTTVLDDPKEVGRNGKTYLKPCLETHNPIDLVILMLGTNDLKERFDQSAKQIAENNEELIKIVKQYGLNVDGSSPIILLISPAWVDENSEIPMEGMQGAEAKSKQFGKFYQGVAERQGCEFLDISLFVQPSRIDGCHFEVESHARIAEVLVEVLGKILN